MAKNTYANVVMNNSTQHQEGTSGNVEHSMANEDNDVETTSINSNLHPLYL